MNYDSIYIAPAGVKGYAYIGSLLYLNKYIDIYNLKKYIGSSSGSIIVFLICVGLPLDKIVKTILDINLNENLNHNLLLNLYNKKGFYSSNYIINLIKKLLYKFNILENIKFKDIEFNLNIIASDITNKRLFIFNKKNTPNALIVDHAIKSSISIPLFFEPVIYKEMLLIDGGFFNMFKIDIIDKNTLCLETSGDLIKDNISSEYNLKNYILLLLNSVFNNKSKSKLLNYNKIEFNINMLGTNFNLNLQDKRNIINIGIETTIIFCNKRILLNRYFNLLKYHMSVAVST